MFNKNSTTEESRKWGSESFDITRQLHNFESETKTYKSCTAVYEKKEKEEEKKLSLFP